MNDEIEAEVDDRAAAGLADRRHDVLGDQRRPHHVDIEHLPPLVDGRVDAAEDEDRRVVDQDVDRAKGRDRLGRHPRDARLVGDVRPDEQRPAAGLLDAFGGVRPVDSSRSAITTAAPSSANSSAVARPIPAPAPVITATFPASRFMARSSLAWR